jgi:hypothetical protein
MDMFNTPLLDFAAMVIEDPVVPGGPRTPSPSVPSYRYAQYDVFVAAFFGIWIINGGVKWEPL